MSFIGLQFAMSNEMISTTLSGIENREQLEKNLRTLAAPRDEELLKQIREIFEPVRNATWPSGLPENN